MWRLVKVDWGGEHHYHAPGQYHWSRPFGCRGGNRVPPCHMRPNDPTHVMRTCAPRGSGRARWDGEPHVTAVPEACDAGGAGLLLRPLRRPPLAFARGAIARRAALPARLSRVLSLLRACVSACMCVCVRACVVCVHACVWGWGGALSGCTGGAGTHRQLQPSASPPTPPLAPTARHSTPSGAARCCYHCCALAGRWSQGAAHLHWSWGRGGQGERRPRQSEQAQGCARQQQPATLHLPQAGAPQHDAAVLSASPQPPALLSADPHPPALLCPQRLRQPCSRPPGWCGPA